MTTTPEAQQLAPCPFCGAGETQIRENGKVWMGTRYGEPSSVSVQHWCEKVEGQPSRMIERVGRDLASAIEAWNNRAQPPAPPVPAQPALTDGQIALAMLAVGDPLLWGRLGEGSGEMVRQFARAIEAALAARSVPEVPAAPSSLHGLTLGEAKKRMAALSWDDLYGHAVSLFIMNSLHEKYQAMPAAVEAREQSSGQDVLDTAAAMLEGYILCIKTGSHEVERGGTDFIAAFHYIPAIEDVIEALRTGQKGREQAAVAAGSDDKRAALTESILALGTVEQTAPVIGLLVAYIESLAGDE